MKVRAIKLGFDNFVRRRPGTEFEIADASMISLVWMEPADEEAQKAFEEKEAEQAKLAAEIGKKFKGPAELKKDREEAKRKHKEKLALAKGADKAHALSQLRTKSVSA
jgi:hypothetical protein